MTPGSFDPTTCRQVIGDEHARPIEAKARGDADLNNYVPPLITGDTYWERVTSQMRFVIYDDQWSRRQRRKARLQQGA